MGFNHTRERVKMIVSYVVSAVMGSVAMGSIVFMIWGINTWNTPRSQFYHSTRLANIIFATGFAGMLALIVGSIVWPM